MDSAIFAKCSRTCFLDSTPFRETFREMARNRLSERTLDLRSNSWTNSWSWMDGQQLCVHRISHKHASSIGRSHSELCHGRVGEWRQFLDASHSAADFWRQRVDQTQAGDVAATVEEVLQGQRVQVLPRRPVPAHRVPLPAAGL